jgi:hypothetical protein
MNKTNLVTVTVALGLSFCVDAYAESMTKHQYKVQDETINSTYNVEMQKCESLSENANDICEAEAEGKKNIAGAELKLTFKPNAKNRYNLAETKADATYEVAIEKCDDKTSTEKDRCVDSAKANKKIEMDAAKVHMKVSKLDSNLINLPLHYLNTIEHRTMSHGQLQYTSI